MRVTGGSFRYCVNVMCVLLGEFQILRECNVRVTGGSFRYCVSVMCVLLGGVSDTA